MNIIFKSKLQKRIFRGLFIANICIIFLLTFQSQENTTLVSEHVRDIAAQTVSSAASDVSSSWWYNLKNFRQLAHLPEYLALGCTGCLAFMTLHADKRRYLYTWLSCLIVSCVDQLFKFILPTREFSFSDMLFDCIGYSVGLMAVVFFRKILLLWRHSKR